MLHVAVRVYDNVRLVFVEALAPVLVSTPRIAIKYKRPSSVFHALPTQWAGQRKTKLAPNVGLIKLGDTSYGSIDTNHSLYFRSETIDSVILSILSLANENDRQFANARLYWRLAPNLGLKQYKSDLPSPTQCLICYFKFKVLM